MEMRAKRNALRRYGPATRLLAATCLAACAANVVRAEFTTVINSPPTMLDELGYFRIGSNTQLNLYEGAVVSDKLRLGETWSPSENIEVNIDGGVVLRSLRTSGSWFSNTNVVINIRSGTVGESVGADNGNVINIFGGEIGEAVSVGSGAMATISGGSTGLLIAHDAAIRLVGGEFRLNGAPIAGLTVPGTELQVNLPERGVLTGTLADGTPLILTDQGIYGDVLADGSLHLVSAAAPAAAPMTFHAPGAPAPRGLRAGQRLAVSDGGAAPANFRASWGSTMSITGGEVGPRLRAIGAAIDLSGGRLGDLATLVAGSVLNVSGGSVGSNLNAGSGSTVNITGGVVETLFEALDGSNVRIAGGVIAPLFYAHEGSQVTIAGSGFRINGVPVSGLNVPGATRQVDLPAGAVLSGTYADGRQFAFSDQTSDYIAAGTLSLEAAPAPAPGPAVIHAPGDIVPRGLRTGQMLIVSDGGEVGDNFNADWGSIVNIDGGRIGPGFEAVGAMVNISGGSIGWRFDALFGSVVNITGGSLEGVVRAHRGSAINFSGGTVGIHLAIDRGGIVNMSGGRLGGYPAVYPEGVLNVTGGQVGDGLRNHGGSLSISGGQIGDEVGIYGDGTVTLSGGAFGDRFDVSGGSRILIIGSDFRLNGEPIAYIPNSGVSVATEVLPGTVLSGTFEDGTPFAFSDLDGDHFEAGAVRLRQAWNPPPSAAPTIDLPSGPAPTGVQGGHAILVDAAHPLGDNFNAGWGSAVTIVGGNLGRNFEAVGAQVLVTGGSVGANFDAFFGSVVTVAGGSIGYDFTAHHGSIINVTGGEFESGVKAGSGSVVNIAGGDLGNSIDLQRGSEVNFFGTEFLLDGEPVAGLASGQTVTLDYAGGVLSGALLDGTPLLMWLEGIYPQPSSSPPDSPKVTLTLASPPVPEPATHLLTLAAAIVMLARSRGGSMI
jgi:hypothetical protein